MAIIASGCGRISFDTTSDAPTSPTDDATAIVDAAVDDAPDAQQIACGPVNCNGPVRFMVCNGRCITICEDVSSQGFARQQCMFWGGNSMTLRDAADTACALSLGAMSSAWIGFEQISPASGPATNWVWGSGAPTTYTNWAMQEPQDLDGTENNEEQCALMSTNGTWVDTACSDNWVSLCSR